MFSFFKKKFLTPSTPAPDVMSAPAPEAVPAPATVDAQVKPLPAVSSRTSDLAGGSLIGSSLVAAIDVSVSSAAPPERKNWLSKLKAGLGKTASSISGVFGGSQIDEALFEDLESALLMADAGVAATELLTTALRNKAKSSGITHPVALKNALIAELTALLLPLQKPLVIGQHQPTVIMVAGVNGAGKTTSIGKLTKHLANGGASVLLAAADTFRAAAREQLTVWADRNTVEIISQEGGDPAAVSFDAVSAGKARGKDVVLIDTAGRLPTQLHLMEELKKIKRVIQKADPSAPHEVLLVIDGNTGQNAVTQVKAFDDALGLTGLIVTKLDGTAKGGVLAAIARERPIPVYFIGVGEKLDELETFNAREFAQALLA
jgi:fused signal recognition particle receptor